MYTPDRLLQYPLPALGQAEPRGKSGSISGQTCARASQERGNLDQGQRKPNQGEIRCDYFKTDYGCPPCRLKELFPRICEFEMHPLTSLGVFCRCTLNEMNYWFSNCGNKRNGVTYRTTPFVALIPRASLP